jgi:hypothetical protein
LPDVAVARNLIPNVVADAVEQDPIRSTTSGGRSTAGTELGPVCVFQQGSGVDVIFTIFGDFCQFSAKINWRFTQKLMIRSFFFKTSSSLSKKRQFFGKNIF